MGILRLLYKEHAQGTCTGNMRKEARSEETVPQSEYQTDPARLMHSQCAIGRRRSRRGVRSMRMEGIGTCVQGMIGKGKNAA